ncbi:MAG: ornithine carbamoyltransferase [Firmicutes bacterium]|nr:ornithine carbamoyltransferase [Bacillota bacterium]
MLSFLDDHAARSLRGKDLISIHDLEASQVGKIFDVARLLKTQVPAGEARRILEGKTLAMIFTKASTRTRVSFEVGMCQLGGHALYLSAQDLQLRRGETIADTARVLSRYVDGIMIRTYAHDDVLELARCATVPVINGLTDLLHPCQALADYYTILERRGRLRGLKLAYVGDGNNMAHSLLFGAAKVGVNISVATPKGYEPAEDVVKLARSDAAAVGWGCEIEITHDPFAAVKDADVIYTDVWASMGQEAEHDARVRAFQAYQVNERLVGAAREDVLVMHCLPAHRGEEITDGVIEGAHSIVFDQAENRLHVQKAIMALLMSSTSG